MDIQGYEPYGLLGAESLFTTHNVTMLYMEWAEMKKSLNGEHKVEAIDSPILCDSRLPMFPFSALQKKGKKEFFLLHKFSKIIWAVKSSIKLSLF